MKNFSYNFIIRQVNTEEIIKKRFLLNRSPPKSYRPGNMYDCLKATPGLLVNGNNFTRNGQRIFKKYGSVISISVLL